MKKLIVLLLVSFLLPLLLVVAVLLIAVGNEDNASGGSGHITTQNLPQEVLNYRPMMEQYCGKYGISQYSPYLLAIMAVESGGRGNDVMQSSESLGLPLDSLTPEQSIEQACKLFQELVQKSERLGCDFKAAIQSYNYGGGFMDYIYSRGNKYTFSLAMEFSEEYSGGERVDYPNPIAIEINGGWRYDYGNMFYVKLVEQYIKAGNSQSGYIWPSETFNIITSLFGGRVHPITGEVGTHSGVDIGADFGSDVLAIASGTVTAAEYHWSYGNYILLDHGDGFSSLYAHNSQLNVAVGSTVVQGQVISQVGSTGQSTGPHIHLEIRNNGERVDPLDFYSEDCYRFS